MCAHPLSTSLPVIRPRGRPLILPDCRGPRPVRAAGIRGSVPSEREIRVYAIVRSGGRQHKVAVGDIVEVDKISTAKVGDTVELSTLLVVDGDAVTSDPWVLDGIKVQAEIVDHHKGAKIDILRYKNKTGYRRRQGHRQQYTAIKVTGIPAAAK
ncbi:large subunit ribosomal protein L21 [Streptomyces avidinii]|uniref:Large ribosomal subunit protein bL21 n=1 Tax=Streptomyces pratensis (strain ATCC 33331 / IAF-45CD) TaxID=591167 RepID=A0A8D4BI23_STRFA|nr:large subunit ribosomal protein L21 [Streptomyces pratensis]RAS36453.1 large subunit ribosomal protein L21 [Streptomyces avidinii]SNX72235.1 large subunit ribosomal protein L21 [Streptomyces microflavus]